MVRVVWIPRLHPLSEEDYGRPSFHSSLFMNSTTFVIIYSIVTRSLLQAINVAVCSTEWCYCVHEYVECVFVM